MGRTISHLLSGAAPPAGLRIEVDRDKKSMVEALAQALEVLPVVLHSPELSMLLSRHLRMPEAGW